jgi:hypothetical protein
MLVIVPPLVVQIAGGEAGSWIPQTLANVVAGGCSEVTAVAAIAALVCWAAIPATIGLILAVKRDVI